MFAVVRTGGKQYRVAQGDKLRVERLAAEPGEQVDFDQVLMVGEEGAVRVRLRRRLWKNKYTGWTR